MQRTKDLVIRQVSSAAVEPQGCRYLSVNGSVLSDGYAAKIGSKTVWVK
jgi:hypothetical protein